MNLPFPCRILSATLCSILTLGFVACSGDKSDPKAEAPPKAVVEPDLDANNFKVDHPEQFPLVAATEHKAVPALNVTGVVQPDITRAVPVVSLAAGRVVELKARLGDVVEKGQLLLKVRSNDVSGAYQTYLKAQNDDRLARIQLDRAQILSDKGAVAKSALEQAEATATDAKTDLNASTEQLRTLGIDKDHPSGIVDIVAPISGVITDQQVTNASGVQGLSGPNPFTIMDPFLRLDRLRCLPKNDLDAVKVGDTADLHLNAFPNHAFKGRVDNILPVLDPSIHTAKVRLEVKNRARSVLECSSQPRSTVSSRKRIPRFPPVRFCICTIASGSTCCPGQLARFKRVEVVTGAMLPDKQQEVVSGIKPGDRSGFRMPSILQEHGGTITVMQKGKAGTGY